MKKFISVGAGAHKVGKEVSLWPNIDPHFPDILSVWRRKRLVLHLRRYYENMYITGLSCILTYFYSFERTVRDLKQDHCTVLRTKTLDWLCNRRNKDSCSLDGKYLQTCIIYKADINFQKISATTTQTHQFYSKMDSELIPQHKDVDHECLTFI